MPEAELFGRPLLLSIPPLVDLSGLPMTLAEAIEMMVPSSLAPPPMLAMITVGHQIDCLMKGDKVVVGKVKLVVQVALVLVHLAKLPLKISVRLVEGLTPESCMENELLVMQF